MALVRPELCLRGKDSCPFAEHTSFRCSLRTGNLSLSFQRQMPGLEAQPDPQTPRLIVSEINGAQAFADHLPVSSVAARLPELPEEKGGSDSGLCLGDTDT